MKKWFSMFFMILVIAVYLLLVLQQKQLNAGVYYMTHWEYIRSRTNFIPLATICFYVKSLVNQSINANICWRFFMISFLFGLPLGAAFPIGFSKCREVKCFTGIAILLLFFKECADVLLMIGSFDVDSIMVSLLGALMGYFGWRLIYHIVLRYKIKV